MTAVELIRSQRLSDVAEYAYAATVPAGTRLVLLAGSCPLDAAGATVAPATTQARPPRHWRTWAPRSRTPEPR